ncbi:MAG TPA: transglycosylase domain-containing protein, partial [Chitinophagaceae bacterium]|nr:transglycosylase domain-containing protein [Chitinophagaceae bacterium]
TITQQLAKHLLDQEQRSRNFLIVILEKLKEQIIAVKLEKNLTKSEILALYLNTVPWGYNAFGIKCAAKTYFNKLPKDLTVSESAMLIGMLKGSSLYNPVRERSRERTRLRRNVVFDQMVKNNKLSSAEAERLKQEPIKLDFHPTSESQHDGLAPYFRQVVEQDVRVWCKKKGLNIYKDGLRIYTTLDPTMQRYAEEAVEEQMKGKTRFTNARNWKGHMQTLMRNVKESERFRNMLAEDMNEREILEVFNKPVHMKVYTWNNPEREKDTVLSPMDSIKYMKGFVHAGFMAMDPATGEVKAWVGGINHKYFQYDHVNANTKRQVGSTIKPLLYCLAVDNGYSPCQSIPLTGVTFPGRGYYCPDKPGGAMEMKRALAFSKNNATVNILRMVGIDHFVDFLKKLGISSTLHAYPSVCLGADDISVFEMMRAYTMFPNYGINTKPIYITRIEDRNGNLLENFVPERKEVINEITAFKMIRMMMGTVLFGTGRRLKPGYGIKGEVAGKTGTTNSEADAWFIGYTPQLLAGAWVGCDDRFIGVGLGEGAHAAMPIWGLFMKQVQANDKLGYNPLDEFEKPAIMEGMDECDAIDEISLQRANAQMNVSRGEKDSLLDEEPTESNKWDTESGGTDENDYK